MAQCNRWRFVTSKEMKICDFKGNKREKMRGNQIEKVWEGE
jgi:hypothetical protein